jgi:hypothetical protein
LADGVRRTAEQHLLEFAEVLQVPGASLAHAADDPLVEFAHEWMQPPANLIDIERGGEQPNPAGDVEPDPAG